MYHFRAYNCDVLMHIGLLQLVVKLTKEQSSKIELDFTNPRFSLKAIKLGFEMGGKANGRSSSSQECLKEISSIGG